MSSSLEDRVDFSSIRYANCWEDAELLVEALQPSEGDRFLSIGSAGDNSFMLLSEGAEVVAVDLSASQLALVELRREGVRNLTHGELLRFLGVRDSNERVKTYRSLRSDLPDWAVRFWDENEDLIEAGPIYAGHFEHYFELYYDWVLPFTHNQPLIQDVFKQRTPKERRTFYEQRWAGSVWRFLYRMHFSEKGQCWLGGRDPEFFRYVEGSVANEILNRFRYAMTEIPTHDNPYLEFYLTGRFEHTLPPYLEPERYEAIRSNLDKLAVREASVDGVAREADEPFDGFNLSDMFEYLSVEKTREIFRELIDASNPGAWFAYWNLFNTRRGSKHYPDQLTHHEERSRELFERDRAFFYGDFVVESYGP